MEERKTSETARFEGAVAEFTAQPNDAKPIFTMIELALEASNPTVRRWAAAWLQATCNVQVVAEDKASDHAAPPEAANLC